MWCYVSLQNMGKNEWVTLSCPIPNASCSRLMIWREKLLTRDGLMISWKTSKNGTQNIYQASCLLPASSHHKGFSTAHNSCQSRWKQNKYRAIDRLVISKDNSLTLRVEGKIHMLLYFKWIFGKLNMLQVLDDYFMHVKFTLKCIESSHHFFEKIWFNRKKFAFLVYYIGDFIIII